MPPTEVGELIKMLKITDGEGMVGALSMGWKEKGKKVCVNHLLSNTLQPYFISKNLGQF